MNLIQKVNPLNKEVEQRKFFFDPLYNPQFTYAEEVLPEELSYYTPISGEYVKIAEKILGHITKTYSSQDAYLLKSREENLPREEVEKIVREYLVKEKIEKLVAVKFSPEAVARTSMFKNVLTIREPVSYDKTGLLGMLNHDVGTHLFRSLNDRNQIWHGARDRYHLKPYLMTEEGLAVLHAFLPREALLMRSQAIYYLAVLYADSHSFAELNSYLKHYVSDRELRWKFCLRSKRGLKDTAKPGAFSKDQTYFAGAVTVWRWLKKHDFDSRDLFVGKIAVEDVDTVKAIANKENLRLPSFLKHMDKYKEKLLELGKANFFDKG